MEIQGKVALVTGGAHRVGKAIALALARSGAHVAITYNSSAEQAQATMAEIKQSGVRAAAVQCDQAQIESIDGLFGSLQREFERLDILVNSAAMMERMPVWGVTPDHWDRVLNTNLRGPFFIAQAAARWMIESGGGAIINIADSSALRPWPSYVAHTASKSGLVALTKALALALAPSIRVNAIAPGAVMIPIGWDDERWSKMAEAIPLKRTGSPEDVADAVLFCVRSEFMTGDILTIDGGRNLK